MHIRNLIVNTEILTEAWNIIFEIFCIILMCTIYYILYIIIQDLIEKNSFAEFDIL